MGSELKFEDIAEEVAGVYPKVMTEGDMDIGAWSCGVWLQGWCMTFQRCKN